jgi:glycine/serine hydroxymethyltransferase
LKQVNTPEFVEYSKQVIANSRAMAAALKEAGEKL